MEEINSRFEELSNLTTVGQFQKSYDGIIELWNEVEKQQKWWYETAKGHIDSTAIRCRRCRKIIKEQKLEQKKHMEEMAQRVPHPNEAFFKKKY